jgi:hypothetical protein
MTPDGKYTSEGQKRNSMTAEERAKDRAASNNPEDNPKTNLAKLRSRHGLDIKPPWASPKK